MNSNEQHSREEVESAQYAFQNHNMFAQWDAMPGVEQPQNTVSWDYGDAASWWPPASVAPQAYSSHGPWPAQTESPWPESQFGQTSFEFQGGQFGGFMSTHLPHTEPIDNGTTSPGQDYDYFFDLLPLDSPPTEDGQSEPQAKQRVRQRIPPQAKEVLLKWFDDHRDDPYLEKDEVVELSETTGLTTRQVRTFFANARARKLPVCTKTTIDPRRTPPGWSRAGSSEEGNKAEERKIITERRRSSIPVTEEAISALPTTSPSSMQQDPMERFLSSSSEEEGFSPDVLQHSATSLSQHSSTAPSLLDYKTHNKHRPTYIEERSEAAFSSNSGSNSSHASISSAINCVPRRGRKRHKGFSRDNSNIARPPTDPYKIYQCTFCTRDFAQKYDWRRHEESVHMPQKEWTCMPDGPAVRSPATGTTHCVFCDLAGPSPAHFQQQHNVAPCLGAPQSSRTFTRKDKLIQHVGQVHRQTHMAPAMLTWCRRVDRSIVIACGICGRDIPSWADRIEHMAAHFADGQDMSLWVGEPGGVALVPPPPPSPSPAAIRDNSTMTTPTVTTPLRLDPLFPTSTPPHQRQQQQQQQLHPCTHCSARFSRYSDTIFHERQDHRVWKVRPQPAGGGVLVRPPLLARLEGGGGGGVQGGLDLRGSRRGGEGGGMFF